MRGVRAWLLRLAGLVGAGRSDAEIREEVETHRSLLAAEYEQAGMLAEEARRRAAADLGSLSAISAAYQDRRGVPVIETTLRHFRMAARSLQRSSVASVSTVLVLGLGIGAATAVLAVFQAIAWGDLTVPSAGDVVRLSQRFDGVVDRRVQGQVDRFSYPEFEAYRVATRTLAGVAAVKHDRMVWRRDGEERPVRAAKVTGDYFRVLPVRPDIGRLLAPDDARNPVAVISHRLWTRAFGAEPDVTGRPIDLDGVPYTVIGVAPGSFSGTELEATDVWLPLEVAHAAQGRDAMLADRNLSWLQVLARVESGAPMPQLKAEAALIAGQLEREYPGRRTTIRVSRATRLDDALRGKALAVGALASLAIGILFLVCGSNAASVLMARGTTRRREIAVRVALGAAPRHVVWLLLAEMSLIGLASAGVGLVVCFATLRTFASVLPIGDIMAGIRPDAGVFGLTLATASVVTFACGLAPGRQLLRVDCLPDLKGEESFVGRRLPALRLRQGLIALQVCVSVVLLVAVALLGRGIGQIWNASLGYATLGLFVIQPDANWDAATGSRPRDRGDFSWQLATVLASDSRVRAVTLVTLAPFAGTGHSRAAPGPDVPVAAVHFNDVDARYFETLDVPLVAGRSFLPGEADAVVVNSALARRFWGEDRSALDRLLYVPSRGTETMRPLRVVGVSPTLQTRDVGIPDEPTYYTLLTPRASGTSFVVLRAREGAPVRQLASDAAQGIAPGQSISVASLDDRLRASTGELRVALGVLAFLGALAVLVAAVGIHGLIAFTISARFREIGVCRTLGAAPTQVLRLILGWTMTGVTLGTIGAVILTVAASTLLGGELQGLLNGLSPLDPLSFLFAVSVLGLSVALATYLPARRALGIAPVAALRSE